MRLGDFTKLYQQTFGKIMPPLLNQTATEYCRTYDPDWIKAAFETAAASGAGHFNFVVKVLENRKDSEMTEADWAKLAET